MFWNSRGSSLYYKRKDSQKQVWCIRKFLPQFAFQVVYIYMSHFAYVCKMRCPLNLVLESWEYLWSYLTFWVVILDYGLKLHKLSIHTLIMLQKWLEIH